MPRPLGAIVQQKVSLHINLQIYIWFLFLYLLIHLKIYMFFQRICQSNTWFEVKEHCRLIRLILLCNTIKMIISWSTSLCLPSSLYKTTTVLVSLLGSRLIFIILNIWLVEEIVGFEVSPIANVPIPQLLLFSVILSLEILAIY
jgi:hypothetical protein